MRSTIMFVLVAMAAVDLIYGRRVKDQRLLPCDFEKGMCSYSNWPSNDKDWVVTEASTVPNGPPTDHTLKRSDGHYAYLHGSGFVYADLEHINITIAKNSCLSFWFYLSNDTVAYVDVYMTVGSMYETLYYYDAGAGRDKQWIHGYADLPTYDRTLVFFAGQLRDYDASKQHYVAIDDIDIFEKSCADQFKLGS